MELSLRPRSKVSTLPQSKTAAPIGVRLSLGSSGFQGFTVKPQNTPGNTPDQQAPVQPNKMSLNMQRKHEMTEHPPNKTVILPGSTKQEKIKSSYVDPAQLSITEKDSFFPGLHNLKEPWTSQPQVSPSLSHKSGPILGHKRNPVSTGNLPASLPSKALVASTQKIPTASVPKISTVSQEKAPAVSSKKDPTASMPNALASITPPKTPIAATLKDSGFSKSRYPPAHTHHLQDSLEPPQIRMLPATEDTKKLGTSVKKKHSLEKFHPPEVPDYRSNAEEAATKTKLRSSLPQKLKKLPRIGPMYVPDATLQQASAVERLPEALSASIDKKHATLLRQETGKHVAKLRSDESDMKPKVFMKKTEKNSDHPSIVAKKTGFVAKPNIPSLIRPAEQPPVSIKHTRAENRVVNLGIPQRQKNTEVRGNKIALKPQEDTQGKDGLWLKSGKVYEVNAKVIPSYTVAQNASRKMLNVLDAAEKLSAELSQYKKKGFCEIEASWKQPPRLSNAYRELSERNCLVSYNDVGDYVCRLKLI